MATHKNLLGVSFHAFEMDLSGILESSGKLTQPFTAIEVARRQGLIGYILRLMGDIPQEHYWL